MRTVSICAIVFASILSRSAEAQWTFRASVSSSGAQANGSSYYTVISSDGRCVVFYSDATNLSSGDFNQASDVFLYDRISRVSERVSVSSTGSQGFGSSGITDGLAVSSDGRFVAFCSSALGLVIGDGNGMPDVFVRDRQNHTTERASVSTSGTQANGFSGTYGLAISADGRYVAFGSDATNLVTPDTNFGVDVFVRDRQLGTTERVSVNSAGVQGNSFSQDRVSISADGRFVAFGSQATNLVPGDTNDWADIFVRDRLLGTTVRASVGPGGVEANSSCLSPSISADGRYVAFTSASTNLTVPGTNGHDQVFVHDMLLGTNELVSITANGLENAWDNFVPSISADGRFVAFMSVAQAPGWSGSGIPYDVFLRDRIAGTTTQMSVSPSGQEGNQQLMNGWPSVSGDGRFVTFNSDSTNFVSGDTNGYFDAFVRDNAVSGFTSLCFPGIAGVVDCPCGNPPGAAGRGCDNSAGTGGATLSASGFAYLTLDDLVFTASGERPTALSILLQGNGVIESGAAFGQGVRCVGGTILRRLFIGTASGGTVQFPDSTSGASAVSTRSAALGDPILAGESRWYLAYYRDPSSAGACTQQAGFNATQTGMISWSP